MVRMDLEMELQSQPYSQVALTRCCGIDWACHGYQSACGALVLAGPGHGGMQGA